MNKRFVTIWATVSVGGAMSAQGTNKPLEMSVAWAALGLVAALLDSAARKTSKKSR